MAARKRSTGSKSRSTTKRRPSNARRKPKAVKHAAGPSDQEIIAKAEAEAPGFQRNPSWGHYSYLSALMGRVAKSAFSGYAAPTNAAEANVQIRTIAGVKLDAARTTSEKQIKAVLAGKASAKSPIADEDQLRLIAAKTDLAEQD